MPEIGKLIVLTPWYPSPSGPYDGTFVQQSTAALGHPAEHTTIVHVRTVPLDAPVAPLRREQTPLGQVIRIEVAMAGNAPRADVCDAQARALRNADLPELRDADVVHAHVGMPTGAAVVGLLTDHQRFVLTEHASYIPTVLRNPAAVQRYARAVERASAVLCVSEAEARRLRVTFNSHRDKVFAIGNPVDGDLFPMAEHRSASLTRWLYVGNLVPGKRVDLVLRSFAEWSGRHPGDNSLTVVGQGISRDELGALAEELDIAERVSFAGPVPPSDLPTVFAEHDVLVHLSARETFGLTVIEATLSGLPVVVATSGGPQETLSDAVARHTVEFVGRTPAAQDVADAVDRLAANASSADPHSARDTLLLRFGRQAFGARLTEFLTGQNPVAPGEGPRVLLLSTSPLAEQRLIRFQAEVLRCDAQPLLLTVSRSDALAADPRTMVLDLARARALLPWRVVERIVLHLGPKFLLLAIRKALSTLSRIPGPQRALLRRGANAATRMISLHAAVEARIMRVADRWFLRFVEPPVLASIAARKYGTWWRNQAPDIVVQGDGTSLPLAWRIAQDLPDAQITGTVSDPTLRDMVKNSATPGASQPES